MSKKKPPSIENVRDLRLGLTELWDMIMNDEIDLQKAKSLNVTASNILKSVSVQDTHAQINGLVNKIDFMEIDASMKTKRKGIGNEVFEN